MLIGNDVHRLAMRVQRSRTELERSVARRNLPRSHQAVMLILSRHFGASRFICLVIDGIIRIAGPPHTHGGMRAVSAESILLIAGERPMVAREAGHGYGVAQFRTHMSGMLGHR